MLGADGASRQPRVRQLVGLALVEPDRERAQRCLEHRRHQPGEPARVDAAGQEQADGHVAHQMTAAPWRPSVARRLAGLIAAKEAGDAVVSTGSDQ